MIDATTLQRVLDRIATSGETVVVVDGKKAFVVMDFDRYQSSDAAPTENLDQANQDIAAWQQGRSEQDIDSTLEYASMESTQKHDTSAS